MEWGAVQAIGPGHQSMTQRLSNRARQANGERGRKAAGREHARRSCGKVGMQPQQGSRPAVASHDLNQTHDSAIALILAPAQRRSRCMLRGSGTCSGRRRQEELGRRPSAAQAYTPSRM